MDRRTILLIAGLGVLLISTSGGLAVDTQATATGLTDEYGGLETPPEAQVTDANVNIQFQQVFTRLPEQAGQYLVLIAVTARKPTRSRVGGSAYAQNHNPPTTAGPAPQRS